MNVTVYFVSQHAKGEADLNYISICSGGKDLAIRGIITSIYYAAQV